MKEYIEREAIREYFHLGVDCNDCEQDARRCRYFDEITRMDICSAIDDIPAADVVEVVQCKDCKWYQLDHWGYKMQCEKIYDVADGDLDAFYFRPSPEHFCSYGERKGGTSDDPVHP